MTVLNVTSGVHYATLSAAISASQANDVIQVSAGSYVEDFPDITHNLTIQSVGGLAHLTTTSPIPVNGRAILNVPGDLNVSLTISGLELSGAVDAYNNGAGILFETGNANLTVLNSWIHGNQDGILTGGTDLADPGGMHVVIQNSELDHNGVAPNNPRFGHNIYVGSATSLVVTGSYIHDALSGHEIKSEAAATVVEYNRIQDGPTAATSYSVDMGSGGTDTIAGNVFEKGPNTPNEYFIHFGGEAVNVNSSLLVSGNTIINDRDHSILLLNQSQDAAGNNIPAVIENNTLYGMSPSDLSTDLHAPPPDVSIGNSFLALPGPPLDTSHPSPIIRFDNVVVGESDGFATFVVTLSAPSISKVTVSFNVSNLTAVSGSDYTAQSGTLSFTPGQISQTIKVPIINDTVVEQKESFLLNLFSPTNAVIGNSSAVATIIDNDGPSGTPVMSIGDRVVDEFAGVVTFAVTLDRPSVGTVNVNYATAPGTAGTTDYGTTSGALTFAPGEMVKTVSVPIVNDAVAEGDEKFDLVLSSPVGATLPDPRGTALIEANDQTPVATPVISVDKVMVGENAGFVDFVVRLNAPSNSVTVSYKDTNLTAVSGSDYDAVNGTLKFAPGETVKTVRVPIINDTTVEPDETFAFILSSPVNATIAAGSTNVTATIVDDDTAPVLAYGASNDTYVVSQSATRIIEAPTGGIDLARSSVTYTLPVNVENLTLTGGAPINGTGNAGNNVITGNSGNNVLSGLGGVDTVSYATAAAGVTVSLALTTPQNTGGAGTDTLSGFENLTGSNFADNLTGSSAANVINGGAGADVMSGGAGNDIYYVDNAADKVNEAAGQGTDTVYASVSYTLTAGSEIEYLRANAGATGLTLTGNALNNTIVGGTGNDTLNGGAGNDVLNGGAGNDTSMARWCRYHVRRHRQRHLLRGQRQRHRHGKS